MTGPTMTEFLQSFDLSAAQWAMAIFSGVLIGIAKTGIGGAGMLTIPLFAAIFGGKPSAGLLLPILCFGDVIGVAYYHRHADWHHLRRLLPWSGLGIIAGAIVGTIISDGTFNIIMATTILGGVTLTVIREHRIKELAIPSSKWFSASIGLAGGFTSMIGNAAGPVISIYVLAMKIPKYTIIGTWAWFFLIVNFAKVPFHIIFWKTITWRTFAFDLALIPAILVGTVIGIYAVKKIPEKTYRTLILVTTAVAALKLLF